MMIKNISLILFFLNFLLVANSYCQRINDSILFWSNEKKLAWHDFKGIPPDSSSFYARSAIKIITEGYWEDNMPNYSVKNVFYRYNAWKKDTISGELLHHEQLHFDIAELYVRKIRKGIAFLRKEFIDEEDIYGNLISKYFKEYAERDEEFDKETNHGIHLEEQKKWCQKIARELEELSEYAEEY